MLSLTPSQSPLMYNVYPVARQATPLRIRHNGLRRFAKNDDTGHLPIHLLPRLRRALTVLEMARKPRDIDRPGYRLHPLHGEREGTWSIRISGNWRLTFRFDGDEVVDVDLVDYH